MWIRKVIVESDVQRGNPISTTGGHVWDAAFRLADFLEAMEGELDLRREGLKILELGAGCGWLGMTVARNLPSATVTITEMEAGGALEHLKHNVEINKKQVPLENVEIAACDWSFFDEWAAGKDVSTHRDKDTESEPASGRDQGADLRNTDWDLIIGSDLVYNEAGVRMLPRVIRGLTRQHTTVFYCHTKHRFDMMDQDFFSNIAASGIACEETTEIGVEAAPPSPPLFENLFAEMRIAVFRMSLPSGASETEGVVVFERERYTAPEMD